MNHQENLAESGPAPLFSAAGTGGAIDTETLELLEAWAREDTTDNQEKLNNAQSELDDFKRAMNHNRAVCGERPLYP